jgi:hypothetical protein
MAEMVVKHRQGVVLPEKMEAHLVPYQKEAYLAVECQELE